MMTTASKERKPGLLARLLRGAAQPMAATYAASVAEARRPEWYATYGVPDTIDGRFDMLALIMSIVLLRLERDGLDHEAVQLTERFIDDMDGQVRQIGYGDVSVGKQVGGIMSLLGGRLGAHRAALDAVTLERTLYRGKPPTGPVFDDAVRRIGALRDGIDALPIDALRAGRLS